MSNAWYSCVSRAYGSVVMLAHLKGQSRIPYLDRVRLSRIRDARVRQIVQHAAANVPFYKDFFRTSGISPGDIRGAGELRELPLLSKEEVRAEPERFRSRSYRGRRSEQLLTSGSTGQRLTVWHDRRSLLAQAAFGERERDVQRQIIGGGVGARLLKIAYPNCTPETIWSFYRRAAYTPVRPNWKLISVSLDFQSIMEEMADYHPDVLLGYGSFLNVFFRRLQEAAYKGPLPKLVKVGGDAIPSSARRIIEEQFGIPVICSYGTVECLKIGFECEERAGYHIHEDLCHLEVMTSSDGPARPDQVGEVVISNLVNFGTVLINYKTGDLASLSSRSCPCGRTFKLLSQLEGRLEDIIYLKNGQIVHPRRIWGIFKKEPILQYQLTQLDFDSFELKLVTGGRDVFEQIKERVDASLRGLLGQGARLSMKYFDTLERSPSGKFHPVVSKLGRSKSDVV